ncbi:hypothetical protein XNA1_2960011 [Xenorhabdus nematophila str. Anatoliense]|nr:hypothetical protein XNA1_2960011 [Xenorhabdus nematophila str. Anatoliense]
MFLCIDIIAIVLNYTQNTLNGSFNVEMVEWIKSLQLKH